MGISHSTAAKTYKKYKNSEDFKSRPRLGRPITISGREKKSIVGICRKDPGRSSRNISSDFSQAFKKSISSSYVRTILLKYKLKSYVASKKPLLTKKMTLKRLEWCNKYASKNDEFWSKVIFSDESTFTLNSNNGKRLIRRFSYENNLQSKYIRQTIKHPTSVMIWGCFSGTTLGPLHICEGYMNSEKYVSLLETKLKPFLRNIRRPIFQDDSAPCHRAKIVSKFMVKNRINQLDWPGNSPDLNPIENLWAIMKIKVAEQNPKSRHDLIQAITTAWNNQIDETTLRNLFKSMKRRIEHVRKNKGGTTEY